MFCFYLKKVKAAAKYFYASTTPAFVSRKTGFGVLILGAEGKSFFIWSAGRSWSWPFEESATFLNYLKAECGSTYNYVTIL